MRRFIFLLVAAALLAGCAGAPTRPPVADPERAWERHRATLTDIAEWRLAGRLALRTGAEGWHASLNWEQRAGHYLMRINAPLGGGGLRLEGDAERVTLRTSDGQSAVSQDPDQLLYQQLGWYVPVENLRYWVIGLPAPGPARHRLDAQGRLERLWQSGWIIEFMDYEAIHGVEVPGRIFAQRGDTEVRLVIGNWDLPAPAREA